MTLAHERTSDFLEGGRRQRRQIVTPEGVPLTVELADYGERLVAFIIDLFIWFLLILAIFIPLVFAIGSTARQPDRGLDRPVHRLHRPQPVFRLVRAGLARRNAGQARGRPAGDRSRRRPADAVRHRRAQPHARDRDLPAARRSPDRRDGAGGVVDWENLVIAVWMLFFAALPFINRDRMRGGDLIAGTWSFRCRSGCLSGDLVERKAQYVVHRAAIAGLWRVRAAGARGIAAPARSRPTRCGWSARSATRSATRSAGRRPFRRPRSCRSCASSIPPSAPSSSASSCSARRAPTSSTSPTKGMTGAAAPIVSVANEASSVEHRRDLLDVDAFLGHAQVVIGDDDGDCVDMPPRAAAIPR